MSLEQLNENELKTLLTSLHGVNTLFFPYEGAPYGSGIGGGKRIFESMRLVSTAISTSQDIPLLSQLLGKGFVEGISGEAFKMGEAQDEQNAGYEDLWIAEQAVIDELVRRGRYVVVMPSLHLNPEKPFEGSGFARDVTVPKDPSNTILINYLGKDEPDGTSRYYTDGELFAMVRSLTGSAKTLEAIKDKAEKSSLKGLGAVPPVFGPVPPAVAPLGLMGILGVVLNVLFILFILYEVGKWFIEYMDWQWWETDDEKMKRMQEAISKSIAIPGDALKAALEDLYNTKEELEKQKTGTTAISAIALGIAIFVAWKFTRKTPVEKPAEAKIIGSQARNDLRK
jgi:hypothetical protein